MYGQIAYEAYCKQSKGVSLISHALLPAWSDLKSEIQEAWDAAADAVREAVLQTQDEDVRDGS